MAKDKAKKKAIEVEDFDPAALAGTAEYDHKKDKPLAGAFKTEPVEPAVDDAKPEDN